MIYSRTGIVHVYWKEHSHFGKAVVIAQLADELADLESLLLLHVMQRNARFMRWSVWGRPPCNCSARGLIGEGKPPDSQLLTKTGGKSDYSRFQKFPWRKVTAESAMTGEDNVYKLWTREKGRERIRREGIKNTLRKRKKTGEADNKILSRIFQK